MNLELFILNNYGIEIPKDDYTFKKYNFFKSFFKDFFIDTPTCFKNSKSLVKRNGITTIEFINYFMRDGKKLKNIHLFNKIIFNYFNTFILNYKTQMNSIN